MRKLWLLPIFALALASLACALTPVDQLPTATPEPTFTPIRNATATATLPSSGPTEEPLVATPTPWLAEAPPRTGQSNSRAVTGSTVEPESDFNGCEARDGWVVYTVMRGDTVTGIARRLAVSYADLVEANCLSNPERISVGQLLQIPPQDD